MNPKRAPMLLPGAGFALAALVSGATLVAAVKMDPASGQIRGMVALSIWPRVGAEVVEPAGYEAFLVRRDQPGVTVRIPAGQWSLPPEGSYRIFLEGKQTVSAYPTNLEWKIEPFKVKGAALAKECVPAGVVRLDGVCADASCRGWMLHETSNIQSPVPYFSPEMLREPPFGDAQKGVLMPAGRVITALYDAKAKKFVGVATPVQVSRGQTVSARPVPPKAGRSALMLELLRPKLLEKRPQDDLSVSLVASDGKTLPAVFVTRTHNRVFAVWPDVPAGAVRLEVASASVRLSERDLRLRSGAVDYVVRKMEPFPKLAVNMRIDERMPRSPATLTMVDLSGETAVITRAVENPDEPVEMTVPAARLKVTMAMGAWEVSEVVDLTNGLDQNVTLAISAIRVSGHVYLGDVPTPATLTFETRASWEDSLTVKTDENGAYEAWIARPDVYMVLVALDKRSGPFASPGLRFETDTTHDFRLPDNRYLFRVTNKHTGAPIVDANVLVENESDEVTASQRLKTDALGEATAQPLRPGTMNVRVDAADFEPSDPQEAPVVVTGSTTIAVQLVPKGDEEVLTLEMPDGSPAVGAEILIDVDRASLWVVKTDQEGRAGIPVWATNSVIAVHADGAALFARRWPGSEQHWRLEPPAPRTFVVRALRGGSDAGYFSRVLWLDGVRLSGLALAWLSREASHAPGWWTLPNLPARAVGVLLYRHVEGSATAAGLLDSMRTDVAYPWPTPVEVEVLQ